MVKSNTKTRVFLQREQRERERERERGVREKKTVEEQEIRLLFFYSEQTLKTEPQKKKKK